MRFARPLALVSLAALGGCHHDDQSARNARPRESERERDARHIHKRPSFPSSLESRMRIAEVAARERRRDQLRIAEPTWASLGPLGGDTIDQTGLLSVAESGLVESIRLDPRASDRVTIATAGGGLWQTTDITAASPDWRSLTDGLGNLAIGGFDIDPALPDTIIVGIGEPFYQPGGFVQITRDGGKTWGAPVALGTATNVREVRIDPSDDQLVLVTTDVGLFRSTDGGARFDLIDLPNPAVVLGEAAWSVVYTGRDATGSHWSVSAVAACDVGLAPPEESTGLPPGAACKRGNPGDIWRSTDSGATWTMSVIPASTSRAGTVARAGRMALAAGDASDPTKTVVYAMVANRDEVHAETVNIFRSDDGGATWLSAKGTLTNPDTVCTDMDVGSVQSGFNQAIAVDPNHPERVVVAGLFCSVRSIDATSASPTWQVVSDVFGPQTSTSCGAIPYVHSDFHAALITPSGRLLLGGDGGIEASDDVLVVAAGAECSTRWIDANRGLATHLCYSITSGDPAFGDDAVVYTGMQDLSSRWRDATNPDRWNTINLSDGTGGAVMRAGDQTLYWAAQVTVAGFTMDRAYCRRAAGTDCGLLDAWTPSNPTLPAGDSESFITLLAPLGPEGGVISTSSFHVWKADATPAWTDISGQHCEIGGGCTTGSFSPYLLESVTASPTIARLYGAAMFDHAAVTSDGGGTWTISAPIGIGGALLGFAPATVALPGGTGNMGDSYVVASSSELLADGSPVPDAVGHLFATHDRGATWSSLSGDGADSLPNVPVWAVKYDSLDPTDQTLVAATEIGVYRTSDGGQHWARLGHGLPMVRTTDLALASDGTFVRISTWGRGVWQLTLDPGGKGDGEPPGPSAGGCCQSTTAGDAPWLAVVVAAVLLRRRRRCPRSREKGEDESGALHGT